MTIRSIDAQVLVQKVGEVAKIQQAQQVGNIHKQDEFINNISKQTEKYSKTVNRSESSQNKRIERKKEKEGQARKKYKEHQKTIAGSKESLDITNTINHNLDIIV